ncbi:MAG TPA: DUF120 domain-containing protein [Gaiellaceae bacterium]|nr:DUF120 domain-containing protein [Gaiellaceae bacterium]
MRELTGQVRAGRGLGSAVMTGKHLERLEELLGFRPVPGTLNVRMTEPVVRDESWRYLAAGDIGPDWQGLTAQSGYFYLPILVAGHRGIAFQAVEAEPGYPPDQLELICETKLRSELGLADGDPLTFAIRDEP